jgi:hypothetical protein
MGRASVGADVLARMATFSRNTVEICANDHQDLINSSFGWLHFASPQGAVKFFTLGDLALVLAMSCVDHVQVLRGQLLDVGLHTSCPIFSRLILLLYDVLVLLLPLYSSYYFLLQPLLHSTTNPTNVYLSTLLP